MSHEETGCTSDCRRFGCPDESPDLVDFYVPELECICDKEEYQGNTCPKHGKFVCK